MALLSRRRTRWVALGVCVLAVLGIFFYLMNRERLYDPNFDTSISDPAYKTGRPRVLYDEGHRNTHTADAAYKPFADLIRNDGYAVQVLREPVTQDRLSGASVFVIVCALGTNEANDAPAFTEAETTAIDQWVRSGGSLLLVTDHWPYGSAAETLADRFGIDMSNGFVQDPKHFEPSLEDSHLAFTRDNGLLRDHPITRGRHPAEQIQRILTFTGQSLRGPPEAIAFMSLGETALDRPPSPPQVEKNGGDIRVTMNYGAPISAKGRAAGLALEVAKGRVVVLGEAGMLRAQRDRRGSLVGMNFPGYGNRQLALNIMHWLSRLL